MNQQLQADMQQNLTWLKSFTAPQEVSFSAVAKLQPSVQLIRLDEINEEQHQVYRQALVNVYASLIQKSRCACFMCWKGLKVA